ncbi:MAG TPA: hypothetical protein VFH61_07385 [Thermoleophilia bacterium]|nr:hypothetical protein [Thermoleophilia bacterium]
MAEDGADSAGPADVADALARAQALLNRLDELEQRFSGPGAGEVELSLLERSTELVEEAGRLLERLGQVTD